jgi:hypothetical protein
MLFYMTLVHQLPLKSTLYKKGAQMEGSRLMEIWDDLGGSMGLDRSSWHLDFMTLKLEIKPTETCAFQCFFK